LRSRRPPSQPIAYLYPWDVVGDASCVPRLVSNGFERVSLAAAYHSVRAATPQHPEHRFVLAESAALYRPVRAAVWAGHRLQPVGAPWTGCEDSFDRAVELLHTGGLRVSAWVVLTHNSALGRKHRDLVVRNCFGDLYEWALCPGSEEVREYAALLAAEAVRGLPLEGISLEAYGQLGSEHGGHHEKTFKAYTPLAEQILSICCCDACERDWEVLGADAGETVRKLRGAFEAAQDLAGVDGATPCKVLGAPTAELLLTSRQRQTDTLLEGVLAGLANVEPSLRITLHAQSQPWATGASPGLTPTSARRADAVLVPVEAAAPNSPAVIAAARHCVPAGVSVAAYVNLLVPVGDDGFEEHAARLLDAGADELHLYHFGLANRRQLPLFARLTSGSS
jgi:hypothetical protein